MKRVYVPNAHAIGSDRHHKPANERDRESHKPSQLGPLAPLLHPPNCIDYSHRASGLSCPKDSVLAGLIESSIVEGTPCLIHAYI